MSKSLSYLTVQQAAEALAKGGIVLYPTEAVYGIGCDPMNESSVMRLLALKQRPVEKGLILLASEVSQCLPYVHLEGEVWESDVMQSWPGPVTWVLPAKPSVPNWVSGGRDSVAMRVTRHPTAKALCEAFGGVIVSTSANPGGEPPAMTATDCARYFDGEVEGIVSGELGELKQPTQIWKAPEMTRLR